MTYKVLFFLMAILFDFAGCLAQKMMKLDDSLQNNSLPWQIKIKGGGTVPKYYFGDYRIVYGKSGWKRTKINDPVFSPDIIENSSEKLNFLLCNSQNDTLVINAAIDSFQKSFSADNNFLINGNNQLKFLKGWTLVSNSTSNMFAQIYNPVDSSVWWMAASLSGSMGTQFTGVLSDGNHKIEIKPVSSWCTGKPLPFGSNIGYEFYYNQSAVAAVQPYQTSISKKFVWVHKEQSEAKKFLLSGASSALAVWLNR